MLKDINDFLRRLMNRGYYGTVELRFEAGRITIIKLNRTLTAEDVREYVPEK
jgi:hypothetical protein